MKKKHSPPPPPGYNPASRWDATYIPGPVQKAKKPYVVGGLLLVLLGLFCSLPLAFLYLAAPPNPSYQDYLLWGTLFLCLALAFVVAGVIVMSKSTGPMPRRALIPPITWQAYQLYIVLPELQCIFQNPTFHYRGPVLATGMLYKSLVVGTAGNNFQTNDWLSGFYQGHPFLTADIRTTPRYGSEQARAWYAGTQLYRPGPSATHSPSGYQMPEFKGRWLYFNAKKPLSGHVVLWSKGFQTLGARDTIASHGLQRTPLDSTPLSEAFEVFANDTHAAYRLLTPHVLEQLAGLVVGLRGHGVAGGVGLAAYGSCIHVLLDGQQDAFEPAVNPWYNTEANSRARVRGEAAVITTVINALADVIC